MGEFQRVCIDQSSSTAPELAIRDGKKFYEEILRSEWTVVVMKEKLQAE